MSVKERLEELFAERPGLKPAHVAKAIHATRTSISDWLSGKTKTISSDHLFALANYFGVEPNWLQRGIGEKYIKDNITLRKQVNVNAHVIAEKNQKNAGNLLVNNTGGSILQDANDVEISNPLEEQMSFELLKNMYGIDKANIIHAMSLLLTIKNAKDEDKQVIDAIKALSLGIANPNYRVIIEETAGDVLPVAQHEPRIKAPS